MKRSSGRLVLAALASSAIAAAAPAAQGAPVAHAAGRCGLGSGEGLGYTYVTSLTVSGTSCATGRSVVKHHGKVRGWSCSRKIIARSSVQYDARETCHSGSRRVNWSYTENT